LAAQLSNQDQAVSLLIREPQQLRGFDKSHFSAFLH